MATSIPQGDQADRAFARTVLDQIRRGGFQTFGPALPPNGYVVTVADRRYIAVVCIGTNDRASHRRTVESIHTVYITSKIRLQRVAVVKPKPPTADYRNRMMDSLHADVIGLSEIGLYFRNWKDAFEESNSFVDALIKERRRRTSPAARVMANAGSIILITKSLAAQIDAKLETLRQAKPNSDEAITIRDAAVSDYEELRARVSELEKAVDKLARKNPRSTPAVKAGKSFGEAFDKWIAKSGPKHLDSATSMGILCAGASLLLLMGVAAPYAVSAATAVVTGKLVAGWFKGGH